jgi:hypothetical protein
VISVASVVKRIYVRLRFVIHTTSAGSFLALCRAIADKASPWGRIPILPFMDRKS